MITHEEIVKILKPFVREILDMAELSLPREKFDIFRKVTLNKLGKSGFGKELERVLRSQAR